MTNVGMFSGCGATCLIKDRIYSTRMTFRLAEDLPGCDYLFTDVLNHSLIRVLSMGSDSKSYQWFPPGYCQASGKI
jgi:hypothetical protein